MKRFISTAILLVSCIMPYYALADDIASDSRIRLLTYNEDDVYTITTKYGYQTNIVFGPGEEIQTISVGDRSLWQIIPAGPRLFIRPMMEGAKTNMTVLTNRHSYQFDLVSLANEKTSNNIYVAQFVYPKPEKKAAPPEPAFGNMPGEPAPMTLVNAGKPVTIPATAPVETAANAPVPGGTEPVNPNYNYTYSGPDELAPLKIYDDGHSTFFKYKDTSQPLPNIYMVDASGQETMVSPYRADGLVVVDVVTGEFAIKSSGGTIHVYNETLNPPK